MIEIIGAVLTILAALLPTFIAYRQERKPIKQQEAIDALLLNGTPDDVSVVLSGLYDQGHRPPGQPTPDVRGGGGEAL